MLLSLLARRPSLRPKALQYFYSRPTINRRWLMPQTLLLSHHLVDGKQLTATIAPPTTLVACLQIRRLILPLILRSNRPKNLHHCYRIRQNVVGLASPNQSPRDPFAVLCRCRSIILEQSLQLCARLLFSISDNLLMLEQSLQLRA